MFKMATRKNSWFDLNFTLLIWIVRVKVVFSVICQDCPEPCHIPGVCVTRGSCFVRRDVNGIFYRGCADIERWKDLDISEKGCTLQEYLGWNQTKALWCFCDQPLCNRRGILGFKNGAFFLSVLQAQDNITESSTFIKETNDNLPVRKKPDRPKNIRQNYVATSPSFGDNKHSIPAQSGKVSSLDEKTGPLNQGVDDTSFRQIEFNMKSNHGRDTMVNINTTPIFDKLQQKLFNNQLTPGLNAQVSQPDSIGITMRQQSHEVTGHNVEEIPIQQISGYFNSRFYKSIITTAESVWHSTNGEPSSGKGNIQERRLLETTTPFVLPDLGDIVSRSVDFYSNKVNTNVHKSHPDKATGMIAGQVDPDNLKQSRPMSINKIETPEVNSENIAVVKSKSEHQDLPQIWPDGYKTIAKAEKSGDYKEIQLRLDNVKVANLYSKDQVGVNEGNGILEQLDHTESAEQMIQVVDANLGRSSHETGFKTTTRSGVGSLLQDIFSKLAVSQNNPRKEDTNSDLLRTLPNIVSPSKGLFENSTKETVISSQRIPWTLINTKIGDAGTRDDVKTTQFFLNISGYNVASSWASGIKKLPFCGNIIDSHLHQFPESCPPTFTYVPRFRSCYFFSQSSANFTDAETKCKHHHSNSHLATMETLQEYHCISEWLEEFSVLLDGWQGWWTGGIYNDTIREFQWSHGGHVINRADDSWLSSLVVYPYEKTCVWFVPLSMFSLGNYWCEEESGYICEMTL